MEFIAGIVTGALLAFLPLVFLVDKSCNGSIEIEQQKAVKAKVGSWFINEDTGESEFVYGSPVDLEEYDTIDRAMEIREEDEL